CTAEDFRPDFDGTPHSQWNVGVAIVFTRSFVNAFPRFREIFEYEQIAEQWITHFAHLRRCYLQTQKGEEEISRIRQAARRKARREAIFNRRLAAATLVTSSEPHARDLMTSLGPEGMSSDESDHDAGGGEPVYKISTSSWRSLRLTSWLRGLDALHLMDRYRGVFDKSPGGWPHFRQAALGKPSARAAVGHLPRECYADNWLANQSLFLRDTLQMVDMAVNLTHPEDIQRWIHIAA
ncbi:uncharacterized protein B0H18DRAFT_882440, partial [Fomitopsis serialis]